MNRAAEQEFSNRRKQLMRMMGEGSIAILPASPVRIRNRDVEYPYRPDSDFYYLTGFPEPEAVAVLVPGRDHGQYLLFCREKDPEQEVWNGRRAGQEGARDIYHAEDSFPISDIDDILPGLLEKCEKVYYTMSCDSRFDNRLLGWLKIIRQHTRSGARTPDEFISLEHLLHDMRLFKSRHEIQQMQMAIDVSIKAHKRAMRLCQPGVMEHQIAAELLYEFNRRGCDFAYPPIVGGGKNGCILHYTDNADELYGGDLLLVDAGAEYNGYAADITRTFPVNGEFSGEQKAVYEVVLEAQLAGIAAVRPGNQWQDPHYAAVRVLAEGMSQLKIFRGSADFLIETGKYKQLYMHRTGHWLGMDVHDVGDYKVGGEWRELEAGMVMTVEPGMYIAEGSPDVDERWWNIGVRIEDDILVTGKGCQVLTKKMPKTVKGIEELMAD